MNQYLTLNTKNALVTINVNHIVSYKPLLAKHGEVHTTVDFTDHTTQTFLVQPDEFAVRLRQLANQETVTNILCGLLANSSSKSIEESTHTAIRIFHELQRLANKI